MAVLPPHQTWDEIDRTFFKKLLSLCQDVDHHIRIASCSQLAEVARVAGRDVVAKTILPELFELLNDEEVQVRRAGVLATWGGGGLGPADGARWHQHAYAVTAPAMGRVVFLWQPN